MQWPADGIPENPRGWLVTVGSRRLMDQVRSDQSRRNREELIAVATPQSELLGPPADAEATDRDDSLALLFGCCHPELSAPQLIAEGTALISAALPRGEAGPYQLQAAIAAVHDEAATMADTDWPQILSLYDLLQTLARAG